MKIRQFQSIMRSRGISASVFLREDPNLTYFSGFQDGIVLIIPAKSPAMLFVHRMDYSRARKESRIKVIKLTKDKPLLKIIKIYLKGKKIGINKSKITLNQYKNLRKEVKRKFIDISKELSLLRITKTKEEIEIYKKACKITTDIFKKTLKNFRKFKTEQEVAAFMQNEAKKLGCELSFPSIVATGPSGDSPHHTPYGKLRKGFCVIDFGIKYKGYCTDMTRTFYIGKPGKRDIDDYNKVLEIQENCIRMAKMGMKVAKLHVFAAKKLGKEFIHGLGHGIGVEIHENPNLSSASKEKLEENMIFTIEPGIYNKKRGIRIEDDILVTKKGPAVLTNFNKKLIRI